MVFLKFAYLNQIAFFFIYNFLIIHHDKSLIGIVNLKLITTIILLQKKEKKQDI